MITENLICYFTKIGKNNWPETKEGWHLKADPVHSENWGYLRMDPLKDYLEQVNL